ncbi:MAG: hypothetical protein EOO96_06180 [Pedobacter sp.]|nr:MAG: hypothetical protein EOO96_06180 [Pedobacter sp.]
MRKQMILAVFAFALAGCNQREESKANTDFLYFDVSGYFKKEAVRLKKLNPDVTKAVSVNGKIEKKTIKIKDWTKELAIFSNADINKASWKGSFKIEKSNLLERYTSDNKKIPVKNVSIGKTGNKVNRVEIVISNKNILYSSGDTLVYYPDSLYEIRKHQKIKLLAQKTYQITGKLK